MKAISPETISYALKGGVDKVAGWLENGAISIALLLNDIQAHNNVRGGIAEIGVHHGKFFILLGSLLRDGERGVAIDVFDDQELNVDLSGNGNRRIFEANLHRHFGDTRDIHILQADSLELDYQDIIAKVGKIRIFSVDGCHTRVHTINDIRKAAAALCDDGVIIVDDIFNTEWPGVLEGVISVLSEPENDLLPLATGANKLVLCKAAAYAMYTRGIFDSLQRIGALTAPDESPATMMIGGHKVVLLDLPNPPDLWIEKVFSAPTNISSDSRALLESGFSDPESWGVWTNGREARLSINIASIDSSADYRMRIYADAYIPRNTSKGQVTNLFINGDYVGTGSYSTKTTDPYWEVSVPVGILKSSKNSILVDVEYPTSPSSEGVSNDARPLGIALRRIEIYREEIPAEWYVRRAQK